MVNPSQRLINKYTAETLALWTDLTVQAIYYWPKNGDGVPPPKHWPTLIEKSEGQITYADFLPSEAA